MSRVTFSSATYASCDCYCQEEDVKKKKKANLQLFSSRLYTVKYSIAKW